MAQKVISVSITPEMSKFLEENLEFSPSKIIQSKIIELMTDHQKSIHEMDRLRYGNGKLNEMLRSANETIERLTIENERLKK